MSSISTSRGSTPKHPTGPALTGQSKLCRHQCAALPNAEFTISLTHVGEDDLVQEPFVVQKGGFYEIPKKPGLGVTLDQAALEKYRVV